MVLQGTLNSASQRLVVNLAGEMYRTAAINGIPPCRIGDAEKLGIQSDASRSVRGRQADHPLCRLPCCPAGGAANDPDRRYFSVLYDNLKFRGAKTFAIIAESSLPRKTASGRWLDDPPVVDFFPRGNDGYGFLFAESGKILGEITVCQKIKNEIRSKVLGQKFRTVIDHRGELTVN